MSDHRSLRRFGFSFSAVSALFIGAFIGCACSSTSGHLAALHGNKDIFGQKIHLHKTKTLVFFIDLNKYPHRQSLFYAQSLYAKYRSENLDVVAIVKDNSSLESLKDFYENSELEFIMIQDHASKLHRSFGAMDCCGSVMYFDADNLKHDFKSMVSPDNLRQLIEKEVTGEIDYQQGFKGQRLFERNQPMPPVELSTPYSSETLFFNDFDNEFLVVTFFSSLCGPCATGQRIQRLSAMRDKLEADERRIKFIFVFMSPLNNDDVVELSKVMTLPSDIFFSKYLFPDEIRYLTGPGARCDPYTIVLDRRQQVLYSEECTGEKDVVHDIENILTRNAL